MPATDIEKRRTFAQAYAISGNATAAAKAAGVPAGSAHSMGYKWLRSADVMAMVREEQDRLLKGMTGAALQVIERYLRDDDAPAQIRLSAAREVLDRAGFAKPKRRESDEPSKPNGVLEMSRAGIEETLAAQLGIDVADIDRVIDGLIGHGASSPH